ncbi:MAG: EAL domain-containing protein [Pseudomonadota bacterium]
MTAALPKALSIESFQPPPTEAPIKTARKDGGRAARDKADSLIDEALATIRDHFGMPVAYLSRFEGDKTVFRNVSAPGLEDMIKPGDAQKLADVYCPHIVSGALPHLIPDTRHEKLCQDMPITHNLPIGSHVSLPIYNEDDSIYGMFCCLAPVPKPSLNPRDLAVMASFANLANRQVLIQEELTRKSDATRARIERVLSSSDFYAVYQPLVRLRDRRVIGYEALSRFTAPEKMTPDIWFLDAADVGLGIDLELATLKAALDGLTALPQGTYLSINASPDLISDPQFIELLKKHPVKRLLLEISELSDAQDNAAFHRGVQEIKRLGLRIAIDDVGAGYSGLQRIALLQPDMLKIDRALAQEIDLNITHRAIVSALVHFAQETGTQVLVEGVERPEEAAALRVLGVNFAQGWHFGKPGPINDFTKQVS